MTNEERAAEELVNLQRTLMFRIKACLDVDSFEKAEQLSKILGNLLA